MLCHLEAEIAYGVWYEGNSPSAGETQPAPGEKGTGEDPMDSVTRQKA